MFNNAREAEAKVKKRNGRRHRPQKKKIRFSSVNRC